MVYSEFPKLTSASGNMIFENPGELLSVSEVARSLRVSEKTIYGWVYRNLLVPIRVGPRLIRFKKTEIERWLHSQKE